MERDLVKLTFESDEGFGHRARIGLIVLESDQTIEAELRRIDLDGVDWYHARIANQPDVTPETLTAMKEGLPAAAGLLPCEFGFDAIGYACTSAATLIGEAGVAEAIRSAHPDIPCTNPISAAVAAFEALGVTCIGVVTPYTADVTAPILDHFESAGLTVTAVGSFLEPSDLVVGRITERSIADGARHIAELEECDAVFVSCTSLRSFGIVKDLEAELGKPVVSSNLALLWRLLRLAGVDDDVPGLGALFRC
jgi:maleate isomerase